MDAHQQPAHTSSESSNFVCDGSRDARVDACDYRKEVKRALVLPGSKQVLAFNKKGVIVFQCATPLVLSDILVGLGFFSGTAAVPMRYTNQDAPVHEQYMLEKPLDGDPTTVERAIRY